VNDFMNMRKALFLAILTLSGCIMVRGGNNESVKNLPIQQMPIQKSISIEISKVPRSGSKAEPPSKESLELFQKQIIKAYESSGLFSKVTVGADAADVKAEVEIGGDEGKTNGFMRLLNGMTLTLIPDRIAYSPSVETVYKDPQGNQLSAIKKTENVSVWIEFFLLFAMPFVDGPTTVAEGVYYDLNRATIDEARAKGVF
jgi:hypothetical protein